MSQYPGFVKGVSDRLVELTKPAQDAYVDAVTVVSETVGGWLPSLPLPGVVPTQREIVETGFDVAEQVLAAQRAFATRVLDAIAPVTSRFDAKPPKPKAVRSA